MPGVHSLIELASTIDPDRSKALVADFGPSEERALSILLGTAFPPLTPQDGYQVDAIEGLSGGTLRAERRRRDLLTDAEQALSGARDQAELLARLRRFCWVERARIALRELLPIELGGAPVESTARELSALAEVLIELTLGEATAELGRRFGAPMAGDQPGRIVAFGMGKLGGRELNAGSDVDLVFVYDTDEGAAGDLTPHDFWSRVVRQATSLMESPSPDGMLWRVDLRLRPEGSQGAIVNSVAATDRYYETWGRLWERAALLRARAVAGDSALGAMVERQIFQPFVYRHASDPSIASALSDLLLRSRLELSPDPERDLKLGPGGIREAEFFVQALQLIWGGRDPSLRVTATLPGLDRLKSGGLVSDREAERLAQGYAFLRRLEHRVQWMTGVQTHLMPSAEAELGKLARSLRYPDAGALLHDVSRVRSEVSELFASVLPISHPAPRGARYRALLLSLEDPAAASVEAKAALDGADIGEHLAALARRPNGLFGELTRDRYPDLGEAILDDLSACADPEQAASYLRSFFGRFASPGPYLSVLVEQPHARTRLLSVLGASRFVGDALLARPDLADRVLFEGGVVGEPEAEIAAEMELQTRALPRDADPEDRHEALVTALRRAKTQVMLEVAVADLAGGFGTRRATRLLADLADRTLARAMQSAMAGSPRGLSVIALGKLGGRDLGYGSDLDVIFVFDPRAAPAPDEASAHFARLAQRVIRIISEPSAAGRGYELDTRLRPSGSQGMLVTSLGSFARYHGVPLLDVPESTSQLTSSGAAWERQALLRARACAGDPELGARVIEVAERAAYERDAPPAEEMHRLRMRLERELGREREGRFDLKSGRGGLLDIEFCVQWLQMRHGRDARVRSTDTGTALEALFQNGYLDRERFDVFRDGYAFLRRLEQRIHVLTGSGSSVIDERALGLEQLARRMGLRAAPPVSASHQLLASYVEVTRGVREAYLETLGLEEPPRAHPA